MDRVDARSWTALDAGLMILGLGNSSCAVYSRNASRFLKAQVSVISTGTPNGQISGYPRTLPWREWHTLQTLYFTVPSDLGMDEILLVKRQSDVHSAHSTLPPSRYHEVAVVCITIFQEEPAERFRITPAAIQSRQATRPKAASQEVAGIDG